MINKVAIIQARMGSTRLPRKVLRKIDNVPLLKFQIDRINQSKLIDKIIVATSNSKNDDIIAKFCKVNGVVCFRGSEDNVLDRYYKCAKKYKADIIIRICADNPLIDPIIIDKVIQFYHDSEVDYVANGIPPETNRYPDGSDLEVFSMKALERTYLEANDPHDQEHVTFYIWKYNNGFSTAQLYHEHDWSEYRFTVDYPDDFEVVEYVIQELNKRNSFGHLNEIVEIIESNPEIKKKNSHYYYGIGWEQRKKVFDEIPQ